MPLLARTTRALRLTHDGQAFYERCTRILQDLHEARDALARAGAQPAGLLRVDAPNALGRTVVAPHVARFLDRYPEVRLDLTLRDQFIDPVAEGIDVLVRIGKLGDSNLMVRRLGESRIVYCASPAYVRKHGAPKAPQDLARHRCLGYLRDGRPNAFQFAGAEGSYSFDIDGPCHVNDAEVLRQLAIAGKGIAGLFDFLTRDALKTGALVTVLDAHPSTPWPIHALYPKNRHLLAKVRVFLDFLTELFRPPRRARGGSASK